MDMFNAKDRRNPKMDDFMDLKKPSFGGPNSKKDFDKSKPEFLKGYQRRVERNKDFENGAENPNYDTTWKAVTRDTVHRQAGKKPFDPMYTTPTFKTSDKIEEGRILRYNEFVNENFEDMLNDDPENNDMPLDGEENNDMPAEVELDQEKLDMLKEEFGKDMKKMIDEICEKMEMDKSECCDYICAAIKDVCHSEDEEEEGEKEPKEDESEEEEENA